MIGKSVWLLRSVLRRLWVRVAAFAVLAIIAAISAPALSPLVPEGWAEKLGGDAVDQILNIVATSMLAVTTFSLSIAVNAYTAAASVATPRAIALLQEDHTTQTTLATFLGAFVYSVVSIIGLNASYYDSGGRVVLFGATIAVIAIVVVTLLRWIGYLPDFGRMNNILDRVEEATRDAMETRLNAPYLGAHPAGQAMPDGGHVVMARDTGYVQHIDMGDLNSCAEAMGAQFWLHVLPGDFVHPAAPLLTVIGDGPATEDVLDLISAFSVDHARSFDQDPRFGMVVFAEIASRALSPGINDPGTAIAVIERQLAVLTDWTERAAPDVQFPNLHVLSVEPSDMLDDAFRPILRDAAGHAEVLSRLILALRALQSTAPEVFEKAVEPLLDEIDTRVEVGDMIDQDRERVARART